MANCTSYHRVDRVLGFFLQSSELGVGRGSLGRGDRNCGTLDIYCMYFFYIAQATKREKMLGNFRICAVFRRKQKLLHCFSFILTESGCKFPNINLFFPFCSAVLTVFGKMTVHSAPCVFPRQWGHHDFAVFTKSYSRLCNMSVAHAYCAHARLCTWVMASLLTIESPSSSVSILKQKEKFSSPRISWYEIQLLSTSSGL